MAGTSDSCIWVPPSCYTRLQAPVGHNCTTGSTTWHLSTSCTIAIDFCSTGASSTADYSMAQWVPHTKGVQFQEDSLHLVHLGAKRSSGAPRKSKIASICCYIGCFKIVCWHKCHELLQLALQRHRHQPSVPAPWCEEQALTMGALQGRAMHI